jgi:hypothetical protein
MGRKLEFHHDDEMGTNLDVKVRVEGQASHVVLSQGLGVGSQKTVEAENTLKTWFLVGGGIFIFAPLSLAGEKVESITAVFSAVSKDYIRVRMADGSFRPESYVFGRGGNWSSGMNDATIDKIKFMDLARMIADPLARQQYMPTGDFKTTQLVILVYWGSTQAYLKGSIASEELQDASGPLASAKSAAAQQRIKSDSEARSGPPSLSNKAAASQANAQNADIAAANSVLEGALAVTAAENSSRDRTDNQIASLLGYEAMWGDSARFQGTPEQYRREDLSNELEEGRYFVVLMAYDFQIMSKEKKHKLLWETRFSISERRNAFDKALPVMAQYASQYFGQDSRGLLRKSIPMGRVDIGDLKSLGEVDKSGTETVQPLARP